MQCAAGTFLQCTAILTHCCNLAALQMTALNSELSHLQRVPVVSVVQQTRERAQQHLQAAQGQELRSATYYSRGGRGKAQLPALLSWQFFMPSSEKCRYSTLSVCSFSTLLRTLPDDGLGGAEHELQHSDGRGELAGCHILHVADGTGCLHRHHIILVPQAAFQEVIEAA